MPLVIVNQSTHMPLCNRFGDRVPCNSGYHDRDVGSRHQACANSGTQRWQQLAQHCGMMAAMKVKGLPCNHMCRSRPHLEGVLHNTIVTRLLSSPHPDWCDSMPRFKCTLPRRGLQGCYRAAGCKLTTVLATGIRVPSYTLKFRACRLLEESEEARQQLEQQLQAALQQHREQAASPSPSPSPAKSSRQLREAEARLQALQQACTMQPDPCPWETYHNAYALQDLRESCSHSPDPLTLISTPKQACRASWQLLARQGQLSGSSVIPEFQLGSHSWETHPNAYALQDLQESCSGSPDP